MVETARYILTTPIPTSLMNLSVIIILELVRNEVHKFDECIYGKITQGKKLLDSIVAPW